MGPRKVDTVSVPVFMVVIVAVAVLSAGLAIVAFRLYRRAEAAEREAARIKAILERLPIRLGYGGGQPYRTGAWSMLLGDHEPGDRAGRVRPSEDPSLFVEDHTVAGRTVRLVDTLVRLPTSGTVSIALGTDVTDLVAATSSAQAGASTHQTEAAEARAGVERARAILDTLPIPIWERDGDGRVCWGNKAYRAAVDTDERGVSANGTELVRGLDLYRRASEASAEESTDRHVIVGGQRLYMRIAEAPLPLPGNGAARGGLHRTVGYALDQTSLEDARADLGRHIAAHGEVLEHLKSAIAIFGPDRRLKFYNFGYVTLWGLDEEWLDAGPTLGEVLEHLRERRIFPEFADFQTYKRSQTELFTSVLQRQEDMLHLPDGRTLRQFITPHPFGGLLFVIEDVTSTLALERSYNTLLQVQNETLDNLEEGVAVLGSDGRLKLYNPAFLSIWGLSPEDVGGSPHFSAIVDSVQSRFAHEQDWPVRRSDLLSLGLERNAETRRLRRDDGSVVSISAVPLPDGGKLISTLDVTDSDRVEQALRASNEALETADRLKSEFIANVSYQLRTPLNAILGFAEILNNRYFGELNERQGDYTGSIIDASNRLLQLIDDILDLATIEAGYMSLERRSIDIREILGKVHDLTREWAGKQGLKVEMDCPDDIGGVDADDRRLRQALYNLVSNAIKFTPPGGRITLWGRREGGVIRLAVSDTGVGIPEADQRRVFGRFEKGQRHVRNGGIGLGLALVKSFVELHGGRLELVSNPGEGTTISCLLPASGGSIPPDDAQYAIGLSGASVADRQPAARPAVEALHSVAERE